MKVWEKCKELKKADADKNQIATWAYMNRICPCMFDADSLELDEGEIFPTEIRKIAHDFCNKSGMKCGTECLDKFLESEIGE